MLKRVFLLICVSAFLCGADTKFTADSPPAIEDQADLVIVNAKVLTVDGEFSIAEAVAIRDSMFVAVGSNGEVEGYIGDRTRVIDAEGKTVIPGLIESHSHATSVVRREYANPHPFDQPGSIAEIQEWLRTQAEDTPAGNWIRLPRIDLTRIQEGRIPTPDELDEAAPNNPTVFVWQFADRQVQVLNSAALEAAGIDADTSVPDGGMIQLGDDGQPTGVLENASELTAEFIGPREIPEDRYHADLERLLNRYTEIGITSIYERNSDAEGYRTFEMLREEGRLPLRVAVTFALNSDGTVEDTERAIREIPLQYGEGDDWVRTGPLKLRVDGGILYGSAYMREPYPEEALSYYGFDDPGHRGTLLYSSEEIKNIIHTGHRMGWQMSAHVTGDAGVDVVLNAVEASQAELSDQDLRFNLIHAYFADRETAERAARLGVAVDTQPAWYYKDGDALADALGTELLQRFLGLEEWRRAGARVTINSDHMYGFDPNTSLNPYNPFLTMYIAISRRTEGGEVFGPEQKVSREDALRMMTINAAWMNFEESRKGSIEIGKLGDLAILSDDFLTVEEEAIKNIQSVVTVVAGNVVYEAENEATRLDEDSATID